MDVYAVCEFCVYDKTMGSALLCIFRSRFLVYSAGSGMDIMQVVLSGFSMRLFCFVQANTFCRYRCI